MSILRYQSSFGETITFNCNTFRELVKSYLVEKFERTLDQASKIMFESSFLSEENFPPKDYNQIALLDYQTIYEMTCDILSEAEDKPVGEYENLTLDEYYEWENSYIKRNSLNKDYFKYSNNPS